MCKTKTAEMDKIKIWREVNKIKKEKKELNKNKTKHWKAEDKNVYGSAVKKVVKF